MDAKEAYRGSLLFDSDCGAFNALDVDQKEEASPWAGRVAASSLSFSRFRYRIVSLGERCRSSPFDSGGRSTTSTDADAVPSS